MATTRKWTPQHFRNGCWVESYQRSNGTVVKRHRRSGGAVKGHYAAVPPKTVGQNTATDQRPTTPKVRQRPRVFVHQSRNTATLSYVLRAYRIAVPVTRMPKTRRIASAFITAIAYTDENGDHQLLGSITAATNSVSIPQRCRRITLHVDLHHPNGETNHYRLDTPVFFNADGTDAMVPGEHSEVDPEQLVDALDRFTPAPLDSIARIQRSNRVRQRTGTANPDRAIFQAAQDLLEAAPLPKLTPTRELSIQVPGADYTIVIKPNA